MTGPAAEEVGFESGGLDCTYALQTGNRNAPELSEFQRKPLVAVLSCSRYPAEQQEVHRGKAQSDPRQHVIELVHYESVEDQHQQIYGGRSESPGQDIR